MDIAGDFRELHGIVSRVPIVPPAVAFGRNWLERLSATDKEIAAAIGALSPRDNRRVHRYAAWRVRKLGVLAMGESADDFVSSAILLTLEGRRKWYPAEKCWAEYLIDVVGSMTNHRFSSRAALLALDQLPSDYCEELADPAYAPEQLLLLREEHAEVASMLDQAITSLADIPFAADLLKHKVAGKSGKEIQEILHISDKTFKAVDRRVRRQIEKVRMTKGESGLRK